MATTYNRTYTSTLPLKRTGRRVIRLPLRLAFSIMVGVSYVYLWGIVLGRAKTEEAETLKARQSIYSQHKHNTMEIIKAYSNDLRRVTSERDMYKAYVENGRLPKPEDFK